LDIDASNKTVCPGLVDCSAKIKELQPRTYKKSMELDLQAAVAGGITRIVCPPDTDFLKDEMRSVERLIKNSKILKKAHLHPLGTLTAGLSGEKITEMAKLSEAGCIGFTQTTLPIRDTQVLMRALQYAGGFDFTIWLNPIDPWLGLGGVAHSGSVTTRLGLPGIPVVSETIGILTALELMRNVDVRVHFCRVSSERGVQLIRQAKDDGLKVTADVGIHHLHLTHYDIGDFNANSKVIPPFRTERDKEALTIGLLDGTVDCICSDHTPVDEELKNLPFSDAEPGLMGLELLLPLAVKWGNENKIPIDKVLSLITLNPSKIIGENIAKIDVGSNADICIFDEFETWTVDSSNLITQAQNSPFYGYELQGKVQQTIVDGLCVYRKEKD
jgi:dihydroorotase